jgi:branched-subunit amino acid permease
MKPIMMFTIAAVFLIVFGLGALIFAPQMATMGGTPVSSATLMNVRFVGIEMPGLGLIAWLVRNSEASKARDGVTP